MKNITEIKFIADCMLGKLGRWLRICGFDTFYSRRLPDEEILIKAEEEGRVILTRDRDLFKICQKKNFPSVMILNDHVEEQLVQVFRELDIKPPLAPLHRCLECNELLQKAKKNDIENKVPAFTLETVKEFYTCPKCRKVFWQGSHWLHMNNKLKHLLGVYPENKNESSNG